jgi:cytochrome oxidase Cu insertion factor (SCO1/SenC/PrrC family)
MNQKRSRGAAPNGGSDAPVSLVGLGLALLAAFGVVAVFVGLTQFNGPGEGAQEGEAAPSFDLPSTTGERVSLSDYRGESNVLLYFYEHAG